MPRKIQFQNRFTDLSREINHRDSHISFDKNWFLCFTSTTSFWIWSLRETSLCHAPSNPVLKQFTYLSLEINYINSHFSFPKAGFYVSNHRDHFFLNLISIMSCTVKSSFKVPEFIDLFCENRVYKYGHWCLSVDQSYRLSYFFWQN